MEKTKLLVVVGLLVISLVSVPVVADAHWRGGGGIILGFGAGLLSGYLFAPRPVYVAPPVYVNPSPAYNPYYGPVPAPPDPPVSGYSNSTNTAVPAPNMQSKCREWKLIDRHMEDRWDSYYGKWQQVPVEKWGWVEVPCNN